MLQGTGAVTVAELALWALSCIHTCFSTTQLLTARQPVKLATSKLVHACMQLVMLLQPQLGQIAVCPKSFDSLLDSS